MTQGSYPGTKKAGLHALVALSFGLIIGVGGRYLLSLELGDYAKYMHNQPPLFIQHTGITVMYAAPLGGLIFLIFAFTNVFRLVSKRNRVLRSPTKLEQIGAVFTIVALITMIMGRSVANSYWSQVFANAGYSRCSNSFFLTSQWFTSAWVKDPAFCINKQVRYMMTNTGFNVEDVNNYLIQME
ncbi:MAG: hypothetical protein WED00_15925 [Aquisalimonadaceae bacterium]